MRIILDAPIKDIIDMDDETVTEERIGHEISRLGSWFKDCFQLSKIEYTYANHAYYSFEVPDKQGEAILELMGALSVFNARAT